MVFHDVTSTIQQSLVAGGERRRPNAEPASGAQRTAAHGVRRGTAVQVEPMTSQFKAPGTEHSNLKYDNLLSSFAHNFYLRR